jgi:hypothetical protein
MVSQLSPSSINSLLNSFPKGFPKPMINTSIRENSSDVLENLEKIGISGFYNKKISFTEEVYTPTIMRPIQQMVADSFAKKVVLSNPYAYFADSAVQTPVVDTDKIIITESKPLLNSRKTKSSIDLISFWNNGFRFRVNTEEPTAFCLQQLYLPGWSCTIDNKKVQQYVVNKAFIGISVPQGRHIIQFVYKPFSVIISFWLSLTFCVLAVFFLLQFRFQCK